MLVGPAGSWGQGCSILCTSRIGDSATLVATSHSPITPSRTGLILGAKLDCVPRSAPSLPSCPTQAVTTLAVPGCHLRCGGSAVDHDETEWSLQHVFAGETVVLLCGSQHLPHPSLTFTLARQGGLSVGLAACPDPLPSPCHPDMLSWHTQPAVPHPWVLGDGAPRGLFTSCLGKAWWEVPLLSQLMVAARGPALG